jgi:hypothetical protein
LLFRPSASNGREPVDQVLDVASSDAVPHRQRKDVDQFLAGMPQDMHADDTIRRCRRIPLIARIEAERPAVGFSQPRGSG